MSNYTKILNPKIDAIIFDLGKVIVETDLQRTFLEFKKMSNELHCPIDNFLEDEYFKLFELGKISEEEFFSFIKDSLSLKKNDIDSIAKAWDLIIVGVPLKSIILLRELKRNFSIFALSNTNSSHVKVINQHLFETHQIKNMQELFHKTYYSHELKIGKPDKKIFEHVLVDSKLQSNRTLFIDDNAENIKVSKEMGFQTIHLIQQTKLEDELRRVGVLKDEN